MVSPGDDGADALQERSKELEDELERLGAQLGQVGMCTRKPAEGKAGNPGRTRGGCGPVSRGSAEAFLACRVPPPASASPTDTHIRRNNAEPHRHTSLIGWTSITACHQPCPQLRIIAAAAPAGGDIVGAGTPSHAGRPHSPSSAATYALGADPTSPMGVSNGASSSVMALGGTDLLGVGPFLAVAAAATAAAAGAGAAAVGAGAAAVRSVSPPLSFSSTTGTPGGPGPRMSQRSAAARAGAPRNAGFVRGLIAPARKKGCSPLPALATSPCHSSVAPKLHILHMP